MLFSKYFSKKNRALKFWAGVITLLIWIAVMSVNTETRSFDISTSFIVGDGKIITSTLPLSVHVDVEGNLFNLTSIPQEEMTVTKNLSNFQRDRITLYFGPQDFPQLSNVKITSIFPKKVSIQVSPKIRKTVKVDPFISGRPLFGYRIAHAVATPERITISGPKKELEHLEEISTDAIDITDKKEETVITSPIIKGNPLFTIEGDEAVTVTVTFERDIKSREFRFVPLQIEGDAIATIKPATVGVKLRGPVDLLEQLKSDGFSATVPYLPKKKYFVSEYTVANLPEGVTVVRKQNIKKINVTIRKEPTKIHQQSEKKKK
ncbi:YbbR-like domain-containing protein [bacterium]|nr:YbbR-like domain-containing protein [bacterium]